MANEPKRGGKTLTIIGYLLASAAMVVGVTWAGGEIGTAFPSLAGLVQFLGPAVCVCIGILTHHIYTTRHPKS